MTNRIAIIQFPGSNCESETARSVRASGLEATIIRWNETESEFHSYDGYVLPGGFSYQDRVRAGAISAKLPIMSWLIQADQLGKPILGICNGCQILAESGIVPNINGDYSISMALAPNYKHDVPNGFVCDWTYVTISQADHNVFTKALPTDIVLPIPINHGEGRFEFSEDFPLSSYLNSHTSIRYTTSSGIIDSSYPTNPNGSTANIAGLSNKNGNALALMPHPERAALLKQIPTWIDSDWVEKKSSQLSQDPQAPGPWSPLFASLKTHFEMEMHVG